MILYYQASRYSNLDTLNSKIRREGKSEEEQEEQEEDPSIIEEDCTADIKANDFILRYL